MNIFKKKPDLEQKKALEKLVKDNFCGMKSIVHCPYHNRVWCKQDCGYYTKIVNEIKYWWRD